MTKSQNLIALLRIYKNHSRVGIIFIVLRVHTFIWATTTENSATLVRSQTLSRSLSARPSCTRWRSRATSMSSSSADADLTGMSLVEGQAQWVSKPSQWGSLKHGKLSRRVKNTDFEEEQTFSSNLDRMCIMYPKRFYRTHIVIFNTDKLGGRVEHFRKYSGGICWVWPRFAEEFVLDEECEGKHERPLDGHGTQVLAHHVPAERVLETVLTWETPISCWILAT